MNWKTRLLRQLDTTYHFARFVIQHFIQDDCTYIASALAFTTLLALVPLMSVGLTIFSSFPVFQGLALPIQNFIFDNFVPSTGKVVQEYLQQFTLQVSKLPIWSLSFLIITALLVLFTIEQALNKIWRTGPRHGVSAFLLYWSILSLAPIILGLSLAASSYVVSMPFLATHQAPSFLLHWAPFFLSLIGFNFLYLIVPNCPIKLSHAFWGSLFAACLFEISKQGFAYYLIHFNTYELLYGAFAAVPLFFIWIYWVWVITLLGAEIGYALSVHHQRRKGKALDGFSHALFWLHELWQAQKSGQGLTMNELVNTNSQPFTVDVDEMIHILSNKELIHATADGHYMFSRDPNQISLYTLTQLLPYRLPTYQELYYPKSSVTEQWKTLFKKNDNEQQKTLNISLEELFNRAVTVRAQPLS